jgi:hypothetical protein
MQAGGAEAPAARSTAKREISASNKEALEVFFRSVCLKQSEQFRSMCMTGEIDKKKLNDIWELELEQQGGFKGDEQYRTVITDPRSENTHMNQKSKLPPSTNIFFLFEVFKGIVEKLNKERVEGDNKKLEVTTASPAAGRTRGYSVKRYPDGCLVLKEMEQKEWTFEDNGALKTTSRMFATEVGFFWFDFAQPNRVTIFFKLSDKVTMNISVGQHNPLKQGAASRKRQPAHPPNSNQSRTAKSKRNKQPQAGEGQAVQNPEPAPQDDFPDRVNGICRFELPDDLKWLNTATANSLHAARSAWMDVSKGSEDWVEKALVEATNAALFEWSSEIHNQNANGDAFHVVRQVWYVYANAELERIFQLKQNCSVQSTECIASEKKNHEAWLLNTGWQALQHSFAFFQQWKEHQRQLARANMLLDIQRSTHGDNNPLLNDMQDAQLQRHQQMADIQGAGHQQQAGGKVTTESEDEMDNDDQLSDYYQDGESDYYDDEAGGSDASQFEDGLSSRHPLLDTHASGASHHWNGASSSQSHVIEPDDPNTQFVIDIRNMVQPGESSPIREASMGSMQGGAQEDSHVHWRNARDEDDAQDVMHASRVDASTSNADSHNQDKIPSQSSESDATDAEGNNDGSGGWAEVSAEDNQRRIKNAWKRIHRDAAKQAEKNQYADAGQQLVDEKAAREKAMEQMDKFEQDRQRKEKQERWNENKRSFLLQFIEKLGTFVKRSVGGISGKKSLDFRADYDQGLFYFDDFEHVMKCVGKCLELINKENPCYIFPFKGNKVDVALANKDEKSRKGRESGKSLPHAFAYWDVIQCNEEQESAHKIGQIKLSHEYGEDGKFPGRSLHVSFLSATPFANGVSSSPSSLQISGKSSQMVQYAWFGAHGGNTATACMNKALCSMHPSHYSTKHEREHASSKGLGKGSVAWFSKAKFFQSQGTRGRAKGVSVPKTGQFASMQSIQHHVCLNCGKICHLPFSRQTMGATKP